MIKIVAKSEVKMECRQEFLTAAAELVDKSRREEGNISYHLYEDMDDSCVLAFIEEWKDDAAIEKHGSSEHFQRIIPVLEGCAVHGIEITLYKDTGL